MGQSKLPALTLIELHGNRCTDQQRVAERPATRQGSGQNRAPPRNWCDTRASTQERAPRRQPPGCGWTLAWRTLAGLLASPLPVLPVLPHALVLAAVLVLGPLAGAAGGVP
eukprot:8521678-Pyramimonas_sp.AAC.1